MSEKEIQQEIGRRSKCFQESNSYTSLKLTGRKFIFRNIEYLIGDILAKQEDTIIFYLTETQCCWDGILKLEPGKCGIQILSEKLVQDELHLYEYLIFGFNIINDEFIITFNYTDGVGVIMPNLGKPLSKQILEQFSPEKIFHKTLNYLDQLHHHNIIHFDLKPGNILCDDEGNITIIDYGISLKVQKGLGETIDCMFNFSPGTPMFSSPNQDWQSSILAGKFNEPECESSKMDDYIGLYYTFLDVLGINYFWSWNNLKLILYSFIEYDHLMVEKFPKKYPDAIIYTRQMINEYFKQNQVFNNEILVKLIWIEMFDTKSIYYSDRFEFLFNNSVYYIPIYEQKPLHKDVVKYEQFQRYILFMIKKLTSLTYRIPGFLIDFLENRNIITYLNPQFIDRGMKKLKI